MRDQVKTEAVYSPLVKLRQNTMQVKFILILIIKFISEPIQHDCATRLNEDLLSIFVIIHGNKKQRTD